MEGGDEDFNQRFQQQASLNEKVEEQPEESKNHQVAEKLKNYKIMECIGQGAFGAVNSGQDLKTKNMVAIKTVNKIQTVQRGKEDAIMREKNLLSSLKHFNIIELLDTAQDEKNLYFIFESGSNGTLDDLIKSTQGIKEPVAKIMFAQLINYQEYIMGHKIMHRDLKPQNIVLDDYYNLKLIDFGDAKVVGSGDIDENAVPQMGSDGEPILKRKDTYVGTLNYLSPEMVDEEEQGHPLDIWALGCILFKMFIGKVPFQGTSQMKVNADIKGRKIKWPEAEYLNKIMSMEAQDLVNRMIQINPGNRLGHSLENIQILKQHPFFHGVDFVAISQKGYQGLQKITIELLPIEERESIILKSKTFVEFDPTKVMIKGQLCKENWYGSKQLRLFELNGTGELKYYKNITDYKGLITITADTKVRKSARTSIVIYDDVKSKDYTLLQPTDQINFKNEKAAGHCWQIDEWLLKINELIEILKKQKTIGK